MGRWIESLGDGDRSILSASGLILTESLFKLIALLVYGKTEASDCYPIQFSLSDGCPVTPQMAVLYIPTNGCPIFKNGCPLA